MLALLRIRRFFKSFGRDALMLFFACRHAATPRAIKVLALLMLAYLISPIDFIPDIFGVLGWADDFIVLTLGMPWLLKKVPANVLEEVRQRAEQLAQRFGFGAPPA